MEDQKTKSQADASRARKLLFGWPMTLAALTAALLFFAGRVSAWHRGHADDPARSRAHAARIVDHLLDDLDASAEQRTRIHALAGEILERLERARQDHGRGHDAWLQEIGAETIDAGSLESLRRDQIAQADALSSEILTRLTAILELLSPEQRRALLERVEDFRAFHRPLGGHALRRHGRWHESLG